MRLGNTVANFSLLLGLAFITGCGNSTAPPGDTTPTSSVASSDDVKVTLPGESEDDAATVDDGAQEMTETGQPNKLEIGSVAPNLDLSDWVMGQEVGAFENGKIHVVEFWATWCPPCRASMPHLSQLQDEYGEEVTFIGISDEDRATVDGFFEKDFNDDQTWGEMITYSIALDESRQVHRDYMQASGQTGIPAAFVVGREGLIEWIGHPMGIDKPLAQIVDGTWDRDAEVARQRAAALAEEKLQEAGMKLARFQADGDYDKAIELLDELIAEVPKASLKLKMAKVSLLLEAERADEASAVIAELGDENWENAGFLNGLSWSMATEMDGVDLDDALKFAERANELTSEADGSVLDTLARVHYERGELEKAIEYQTKAVTVAPELQSTLDKYQEELDAENGESDSGDDASETSETSEGDA